MGAALVLVAFLAALVVGLVSLVLVWCVRRRGPAARSVVCAVPLLVLVSGAALAGAGGQLLGLVVLDALLLGALVAVPIVALRARGRTST